MNDKFESIYKGKHIEIFFFKENFYPYKNQYSLEKQRFINLASEVENNLAGNISISKIEDNSKIIPTIYDSYYYLALDLFSFENLRTFKKGNFCLKIKSLPKTLKNLQCFIPKWHEEVQNDLSLFTNLTNLEILDLGTPSASKFGLFSAWKGSLESLKDCKKLRFICIGHITDITGLEYLPLDSLETVNLYGTPFDNLLFGDKTLDSTKLTTYSKGLLRKDIINAIKIYQQNFWKKDEEKSLDIIMNENIDTEFIVSQT